MKRTKFLAVALISVCMAACFEDKCDPQPTPTQTQTTTDGPTQFTYPFRDSVLSTNTTPIGVWMHNDTTLERKTIANWLGTKHEDKELFEPINVLWLDAISRDEGQARDSVVDFLDYCSFKREGNSLGVPRHSSGYHAVYGNNVWKDQYDHDDAWVEGFFGGDVANNHGRIFPAYTGSSTNGSPVYFTSGAFSREGPRGIPFALGIDCLIVSRERCHPYVSFNQARDKLNCGDPNWTSVGLADFGNRYALSPSRSFSTGDHDGVRIFRRLR